MNFLPLGMVTVSLVSDTQSNANPLGSFVSAVVVSAFVISSLVMLILLCCYLKFLAQTLRVFVACDYPNSYPNTLRAQSRLCRQSYSLHATPAFLYWLTTKTANAHWLGSGKYCLRFHSYKRFTPALFKAQSGASSLAMVKIFST